MLSSKYQIYQFKQNPFDIDEVTHLTGLSKNSARNLIGELSLQGLVISSPDKSDKRKNVYMLNWKQIVKKIRNSNDDFEKIVSMMSLDDFKDKYVALKNFEVMDDDPSVTALTHRLWNEFPSEDIVIVPIGNPPEIFTIEFI